MADFVGHSDLWCSSTLSLIKLIEDQSKLQFYLRGFSDCSSHFLGAGL